MSTILDKLTGTTKSDGKKIRIEDKWKDFDMDTEYLRDPTKKHVMRVSERDCLRHGVPFYARDFCAHIFIPLNQCRKLTFHAPFRCKDLHMAWMRCQKNDFWRRRALVSRRFYELYGIDDGHDHRTNFKTSHHNPFSKHGHDGHGSTHNEHESSHH
mmetsp:Transcript_39982/g.49381  ORF Transcript_39982/g.49381 Transcript_39982/m.49381 type:complete len:156 (+) Transcript_39982:133-600(+)